MEEINFTTNWNNKLDCKSFTSMRLHYGDKWKIGTLYQVNLNTHPKCTAMLIDKRILKIIQLNEFICRLDTGYSLNETITILKKMYPAVNWQIQSIALLLFIKESRDTRQSSIFEEENQTMNV